MSNTVLVRNRHSTEPVDTRWLATILRGLLRDCLSLECFDVTVYLTADREMAQLNETFLRHKGSTDVLAFDYSDGQAEDTVAGEIFICTDQAKIQARRFRATWKSELVRYMVHAVLHLRGYDDQGAADRRRMKREEDRLLKTLAARFDFSRL